MEKKGKLFILSAPSGCGKTTLSKNLVESKIGIIQSISTTTRLPRQGEINGKDYFFVSEKEFKNTILKKGFLEWTKNFGFFYGTPKKFVTGCIKKGRNVLLSIDVKGALKVKRLYPQAVSIFILPPSMEDLKKRLNKRMTDSPLEINKRLKIAKKEISYLDRYDHRVINDNLKKAGDELKAIIKRERRKV